RARRAEEALALPRSVQDLVAARLEKLEGPTAELLDLVAVLGREFTTDALEAFGADAGPGVLAVAAALEELVARQILEERGEGRYRFVHDKLRDLREQQIPDERRRALHRRVAERLEGSGGELATA